MNKRAFHILKTVLFFAFVCALFFPFSYLLRDDFPDISVKRQTALHSAQKRNSIDVAFLGSSAVFRYYDVMSVWENYGVTSGVYSVPLMQPDIYRPMLDSIRERQSPRAFVIELRPFLSEEVQRYQSSRINSQNKKKISIRQLFLLPYSWNMAKSILKEETIEPREKYLFLFDLLYYHERWRNLIREDADLLKKEFYQAPLDFMGNEVLAWEAKDVTKQYEDFSQMEEKPYQISEGIRDELTALLDYCREEELSVHFVFSPYARYSPGKRAVDISRELGEIVSRYGFSFRDYNECFEEMDLDLTTDFYDELHTNFLGAQKYTSFFMEDLTKKFDLTSSHDEDVMAAWNESLARWKTYRETKMQGIQGNAK